MPCQCFLSDCRWRLQRHGVNGILLVWLNPRLLCLLWEVISLWDAERCEAKITGSYLHLLGQVWELVARGNTNRGVSALGLTSTPVNWIGPPFNAALCILNMYIIHFCRQVSGQIAVWWRVVVMPVLNQNQRGRGIKNQVSWDLLALPPVGNSAASSAQSICTNSRIQTLETQPTVSAEALRFRGREWKRVCERCAGDTTL